MAKTKDGKKEVYYITPDVRRDLINAYTMRPDNLWSEFSRPATNNLYPIGDPMFYKQADDALNEYRNAMMSKFPDGAQRYPVHNWGAVPMPAYDDYLQRKSVRESPTAPVMLAPAQRQQAVPAASLMSRLTNYMG